jgi:regulatory protein
MSGRITALTIQKTNRERVSVYLDGRFAFGLPAIVAVSLKTGQVLSDAEIQAFQERGTVESAYERALNYLSYRPRSRAEVVAYLRKRSVEDSQIESIVGRLEAAGLLDDHAFAQFWVENRSQFRPRGSRALRYELRSKGVDQEVVETALATVDSEEGAYRAAQKKAQQLRSLDQATFQRKLVEYLARRGFEYEEAQEAAKRHWAELATDG